MLVIYNSFKNYYFRAKGKVIVFDAVEKAEWFKENFYQYAIQRMAQENIFGVPEVMQAEQSTSVIQLDFDTSKVETINFDELK